MNFDDLFGDTYEKFMAGFQKARADGARAAAKPEIPTPKKCATNKELADWFMAFARACK